MPVEDVFSISGRGTVVDRPHRARHRQGRRGNRDRRHPRRRRRRRSRAWRCSASCWTRARRATTSALLLRGTKRDDVERGQVLCKPGSITPHTEFEAEVYVLTKEEGGRHTPFFKGYRPQFYFRTTDVTGACDAAGRRGDGDAGRQHQDGGELITPDRDGRGPALRDPRGRPHRRRRRRWRRSSNKQRCCANSRRMACRVSCDRQAHGGCKPQPVEYEYASSSIGRAAVSKTAGWGFESPPGVPAAAAAVGCVEAAKIWMNSKVEQAGRTPRRRRQATRWRSLVIAGSRRAFTGSTIWPIWQRLLMLLRWLLAAVRSWCFMRAQGDRRCASFLSESRVRAAQGRMADAPGNQCRTTLVIIVVVHPVARH